MYSESVSINLSVRAVLKAALTLKKKLIKKPPILWEDAR